MLPLRMYPPRGTDASRSCSYEAAARAAMDQLPYHNPSACGGISSGSKGHLYGFGVWLEGLGIRVRGRGDVPRGHVIAYLSN